MNSYRKKKKFKLDRVLLPYCVPPKEEKNVCHKVHCRLHCPLFETKAFSRLYLSQVP